MPSCLTLSELRDYVEQKHGIRLSMSQLYGMVENDRGPVNFRVGKKIYVARSDADSWLEHQIESTRREGVKV